MTQSNATISLKPKGLLGVKENEKILGARKPDSKQGRKDKPSPVQKTRMECEQDDYFEVVIHYFLNYSFVSHLLKNNL